MDILIISEFNGDFSGRDTSRFIYLAQNLSDRHHVEIVTSDFWHVKKIRRSSSRKKWPFQVTFLHEPGYAENVSLKRFFSHLIWGKNVKKYLNNRKKPDVIYCSVPSLTAAKEAADYCEKHDVWFIIDVQDLWPEAFEMVFHFPVVSQIVYFPFYWFADHIYRSADSICAVSHTYAKRVRRARMYQTTNSGNPKSLLCKGYSTERIFQKCTCISPDNVRVVYLGTDLDIFEKYAKGVPVTEKQEGVVWLAYCGTLGSSYDLTCVMDALYLLEKKGVKAPRFIIMGDGPRRKELERYAKVRNLDVLFTGLLSYDQMCATLASCDIAVNPISHRAAQSIINKHADYAAAGLAVINTQEGKEYRALVRKYQMGFNCRNNDAYDVAKKISVLITNPELRKHMGENARKCARERFDRAKTYDILVWAVERIGR